VSGVSNGSCRFVAARSGQYIRARGEGPLGGVREGASRMKSSRSRITIGLVTLGVFGAVAGFLISESSPTVSPGAVRSQRVHGHSARAHSPSPSVSSATVVVPMVVGEPGQTTTSAAREILLAAGLHFTVADHTSTVAPPGVVLSQSPSAGQTVSSGSSVTLTVSSGPPGRYSPPVSYYGQ
jgi:PASTA domain